MKSKLNTILQLAIIVLLAVVIVLQIFNINNKDADSDFVKKNLSQQKQWNDYQKEVGKKNITVTNDKISRGDYSTSIIGDVTNTSNKTVSGVSVNNQFEMLSVIQNFQTQFAIRQKLF